MGQPVDPHVEGAQRVSLREGVCDDQYAAGMGRADQRPQRLGRQGGAGVSGRGAVLEDHLQEIGALCDPGPDETLGVLRSRDGGERHQHALLDQRGRVPTGSSGAGTGRAEVGSPGVGRRLLLERTDEVGIGEHVQHRGDPAPQRRLESSRKDVDVGVDEAGQDGGTVGRHDRCARRGSQSDVEGGHAPLDDQQGATGQEPVPVEDLGSLDQEPVGRDVHLVPLCLRSSSGLSQRCHPSSRSARGRGGTEVTPGEEAV